MLSLEELKLKHDGERLDKKREDDAQIILVDPNRMDEKARTF
jgi:hypothetical protein